MKAFWLPPNLLLGRQLSAPDLQNQVQRRVFVYIAVFKTADFKEVVARAKNAKAPLEDECRR